MISLRGLRRKVKTIRSIQQITRAMKMVSSIRLKHARDRIAVAQPYSIRMKELLGELLVRSREQSGSSGLPVHPLMAPGAEKGKKMLVVITSDRGLCGGYNSSITRKAMEVIRRNPGMLVITIGKKGRDTLFRT